MTTTSSDSLVRLLLQGEEKGPFTLSQVRAMLSRGQVPQDTMAKASPTWQPLLPLMNAPSDQRPMLPGTWHIKTADEVEMRGPFAFSQLQNMWDTGAITADAMCLETEHWQLLSVIVQGVSRSRQNVVRQIERAAPDVPPAMLKPESLPMKPMEQLTQVPAGATASADSWSLLNYFLPVARLGRGMWFVRNLIDWFAIGMLAILLPSKDTQLSTALAFVIVAVWLYLILVAAAKRLHDLNRSAWFAPLVLIPVVPLIFLILSGTEGDNRFGQSPGYRLFV